MPKMKIVIRNVLVSVNEMLSTLQGLKILNLKKMLKFEIIYLVNLSQKS